MSDDFDIVSNIADILGLGVMSTPALMINGQVVISGRVPSTEEVKEAIAKHK